MKRLDLPLILLAACAAPLASAVPTPSHVVVVVLENHAYGEIIGSASAPYLNSLVRGGALFTRAYAETHPSQPNYLILFSGSNQGVVDDTTPPPGVPFASPNLGAALLQSGRSFIAYSEDLPSVGYIGASSGGYVRRHAPWTDWQGATTNAIPASSNQPFSAFPSDFATLPTVSFVIPNLADDMHDGSVAAGDQWLHDHLDAYVRWARLNDGLLIVTVDEDDGSAGNHIATIMVGGQVRAGAYGESISHRDLLRTIEAMYGLPASGSGGAPISDAWTTSDSGSSSHHCGAGSMSLVLALVLALRRERRR